MMIPRIYYLMIALGINTLVSTLSHAQNNVEAPILDLKIFIQEVQDQYPLLQVADLQTDLADAKVQEKKGAFDLQIGSQYDQKFYSSTNYYSIFHGGARWQSPYAFRLNAGADFTDGVFLNPQLNLPASGLSFLGIELPLGAGLLMDPARAGIRDARLFQELQQQRRTQMRNQILAQALYAYFEWVKSEELVRSYQEIANTASDRYEFVLDAYRGGDLSPIDTLEAYMQWKQRKLELTSAQNERLSAQAHIQNFLPNWNFQNWSPPNFDRISAIWQERTDDYWLETLQQHPQIIDLQIQKERLVIERKLIREQFKPQLNVRYQWLSSIDQLSSGDINNTLSPNDYTWGVSFSYPIPLRKTRGQNQYNKIQQLENTFKIQQIRQELQARMNAFLEIQNNFSGLIAEYDLLIDDFRRLLEAERMMFELGESSLFMVNTRENRLLNAQITFINLQYSAFQNLVRLAQNSGNIEQHLTLNTN